MLKYISLILLYIEEMFIAAVLPVMPIDKLPKGYYALDICMLLNLPQDCHLSSELDKIVVRNQHFKQQLNSLLTGNDITQVNL